MARVAKTGSYWVVHIAVAITLTWALTGNLKAAIGVGILEPTVQAFVFYFHDMFWEKKRAGKLFSPALVPA